MAVNISKLGWELSGRRIGWAPAIHVFRAFFELGKSSQKAKSSRDRPWARYLRPLAWAAAIFYKRAFPDIRADKSPPGEP
jgi:hypothetical protein